MLKRYLVFSEEEYYPRGGMDDFVGDYNKKSDAILKAKECLKKDSRERWAHVYDQQKKKEIWTTKECEE